MGFSASQWQEIDSWLQARRDKLQSRLDAIPDPLGPGPSGLPPPSGGKGIGNKGKAPAKRPSRTTAPLEKEKPKKSKKSKSKSGAKKGGRSGAGANGSAAETDPGVMPSVSPEGSAPTGSTDRSASVLPVVPPSSEPKSSAPPSQETGTVLTPSIPVTSSQGATGPQAPSGTAQFGRPSAPGASAPVPDTASGASAPGPVNQGIQLARDRSRSREESTRRHGRRESSGSRGSKRSSGDHRSRSPSSRSRPRRQTPSESSEVDSDSDAGYRRDRSRRPRRSSPGGLPDPSDPAWVSQLASLLGPLVATEVAKQTAHLRPTPSPLPSAPVADPPRAGPSDLTSSAPPPDSLELMASDEFEEEEEEEEEVESEVSEPAPTPAPAEDESPRGTDLPQSLVTAVTDILISKLGYQAPSKPTPAAAGSRLTATNEAVQTGPPEFPVDAHCKARLESLAAKQAWSAFPAQQDKLIRVPEEDWGSLFHPPSVSEETRNKVRVAEGLASGMFREPLRKKIEDDWYQADLAARTGLKFSSVFLLIAEALRKAHLQLPGDEVQFSLADVGQLVYLLGPLARLIFDQFARIALKSVRVRRGNILDAFPWPSTEARGRLEQLPVCSPDLFSNQFLDRFVQEVKRHEETASAFFKPPPKPTPAQPPRSASKKPKTVKKSKPKKAAPKTSNWHGGSSWRGSSSGRARGGRGGSTARGRGRGSAPPSRPAYNPPQATQFPPQQP